MKNITLAVEEDVLARVREYAKARGTTVNALVRTHLAELVEQESRREEARKRLLKLMAKSKARLGPDYKWNREEIYEERVFPRHKHPDLRGGRKRG